MLRPQFEVRQRDAFDEDARPVDVQHRRPPADAGPERDGTGHDLGEPTVAELGERGADSAMGGQPGAAFGPRR